MFPWFPLTEDQIAEAEEREVYYTEALPCGDGSIVKIPKCRLFGEPYYLTLSGKVVHESEI